MIEDGLSVDKGVAGTERVAEILEAALGASDVRLGVLLAEVERMLESVEVMPGE
jgi:hypothetical protein